ncbi:hypothetical protein K1T73_16940 [Roseovarius sp. SCSIO 43702]|uniref:hypothetical protein n=1 Tax=Roseovarius sp. SCSIO 43702 TaxID=2823043 RepID=UPI001C734E2C|nr:hypothetical protein [Roseovarius sp. SCSIO 43702]QYX56696.1 hypothetical protein K1T73_16940 [Roseovarius sp. SCSIO 43702]
MTADARGAMPHGLIISIVKLQQQLCDMKLELESIQNQLRAGTPGVLGNSSRLIADIRQWLKIALEAEADLERRRKNTEPEKIGHDLDLAAARRSIRCRLDRLRRSRTSEDVS